MKVVLREHVEHLGDRGEIVAVADGYARNYLLPKGLALVANAGNLKTLEHQRRVWVAREARDVSDAQALGDRIAGLELSLSRKAGESGTLYGSVTSSDLAEQLARRGIEIDRRRIVLSEPIKTVGEFKVTVKLHRQVVAPLRVKVVADQARE